MAGSYKHVDHDSAGSWSTIENMGDAYECVEELLYLVRCFADAKDIKEALDAFYAFSTGKKDPNALAGGGPEFEAMPSISDYAKAYLETQAVMRNENDEDD